MPKSNSFAVPSAEITQTSSNAWAASFGRLGFPTYVLEATRKSPAAGRARIVPGDRTADLRSLPNVIMTPHVASNTVEANRRMAQRALQNIALAENGFGGRAPLSQRLSI